MSFRSKAHRERKANSAAARKPNPYASKQWLDGFGAAVDEYIKTHPRGSAHLGLPVTLDDVMQGLMEATHRPTADSTPGHTLDSILQFAKHHAHDRSSRKDSLQAKGFIAAGLAGSVGSVGPATGV